MEKSMSIRVPGSSSREANRLYASENIKASLFFIKIFKNITSNDAVGQR